MADDAPPELIRLRSEMAEQVIARSLVASELVAAALREVPRHLFLPELPARDAYQDEAIVTQRDAEGRPLSSSSQPAIMAVMLDQLGLSPGQRVLEIGAGTGYNAALIRHAVGPTGLVASIDIEPEAVTRAREALALAGYPDVIVVRADGALGYEPTAPYDRIIATVGTPDLAPAWLEQLAGDSVLVAPLDLAGVQCSVAFTPGADGAWRSRSVVPCGFIRMRGALSGPGQVIPLADRLVLLAAAEEQLPAAAAAAALGAPETARVPTGVRAQAAVFFGLTLWLALHEPLCCAVQEEKPPSGHWRLADAPISSAAFRYTRGVAGKDGSIALLAGTPGEDSSFPLDAVGYGPAGPALAAGLAAVVRDWDAAGQPYTGNVRVTAWPRPATPVSEPGEQILERTWTRFAVGYDT